MVPGLPLGLARAFRGGFKLIVAINKYLQAYHMYRAEALSTPEVRRLDSMSRDALATLQKEFPFGVERSDGTLRLFWCTEKPHSIVHWASNLITVGLPCTISTNVTESRMKTAVKTKAKRVPASFFHLFQLFFPSFF